MFSSYYFEPISRFLNQNCEEILGQLASGHAHDLDLLQRNAWQTQISFLQQELAGLEDGSIAFEFSIPRMGKRADNIVLYQGIVFILEFKVGTGQFDGAARDQVVDYALDLKNFHAGSHDLPIVPVLIATGASATAIQVEWSADKVAKAIFSNGKGLGALLCELAAGLTDQQIDPAAWSASGYKPTPTIIEAARALYQGHQVQEITRSDAGAINLSQTVGCIAEIIEDAKNRKQKVICFVTGVPGAGKTLAGLNLVTQRTKAHEDEHAVFLSGNGPLVEVLREALARDEHERSKVIGPLVRKAEAARKVQSFIQNIMHFRDASLQNAAAPIEHVAVFDEAQRAWDRDHLANFMSRKKGVSNFEMSEPEFLISVMDRHKDWCTIVCLVGGGQEINAGEAGLTEWFNAIQKRFSGWKVFTSNQLAHRDYSWNQDLSSLLAGCDVKSFDHLHLSVSVRSFRAEKLSEFVGALIAGEQDNAKFLYRQIEHVYPIQVTRKLATARRWLREHARGSERFSGTKWLNVNDELRQAYLKNAYRVLLTRARQGFVIYVPEGDPKDKTRLPNFYDRTADFLADCGLQIV